MKSIIIIIIVFISLNYTSFSQNMIKIADFNINTQELSKNIQCQMTQFIFRSKQKTSFHAAYDVLDIVKPYIDTIDRSLMNNLVLVFENPDRQAVIASYSDIDKLLTSMPAVLMYDRTAKSLDTNSINTEEINDSEISELDEQLSGFSRKRRIHLQMKTIPVSEKTRMVRDATIVFPADLNTDRWINGIDRIIIFKYKTDRIPPVPEEEEQTEETDKKSKKKGKKK